MDVFVLYLCIATATPLFMWKEHRKMAIIHIPFIIGLWVGFGYYLASEQITLMGHIGVWSMILINFIFAHVAAYVLYASPFLKKMKRSTQR
ncbi:spore morphogenesis/germination protein YwcE [Mangrovibacillus cuniculi]|uniref:Spore gernimation protein n=1 Tax=Mangrovibacillus cuniculi TaxID=2593652 RepID=A0A7S8HGC9_9BACI|nr:spore morphogenesis/germination protein YwcE [Mangrovibacillus cuniculi]QPC47783.1 spore gernimation protein [Mangrovibacillus cuniculi]